MRPRRVGGNPCRDVLAECFFLRGIAQVHLMPPMRSGCRPGPCVRLARARCESTTPDLDAVRAQGTCADEHIHADDRQQTAAAASLASDIGCPWSMSLLSLYSSQTTYSSSSRPSIVISYGPAT